MKVSIDDLKRLIEKLQDCVDEMEDREITELSTSCNTYKMSNFISFGYKGYLSIDNDYIEVDEDE